MVTWSDIADAIFNGAKKIWPDIVDVFTFLPDEKKPSFMIASILGLILAAVVFIIIKKSVAAKENLKNITISRFTQPLFALQYVAWCLPKVWDNS